MGCFSFILSPQQLQLTFIFVLIVVVVRLLFDEILLTVS